MGCDEPCVRRKPTGNLKRLLQACEDGSLPDSMLTMLLVWHIGSVILWFGSSVTFVMTVYPALGRLDQDQRRLYLHSFLPKFSRLLGGAAISAVVAGALLFGYASSVHTSFAPTGWRFIFVAIGAVLGLVGALLTLGVALPLASRFLDPKAQRSNGPKYAVLDEATIVKGLNGIMRALVVVLSLAFVLMVLGAYS